jgi:hypothetical protein
MPGLLVSHGLCQEIFLKVLEFATKTPGHKEITEPEHNFELQTTSNLEPRTFLTLCETLSLGGLVANPSRIKKIQLIKHDFATKIQRREGSQTVNKFEVGSSTLCQ